jgi:hypothetical protein
MCWNQYVSINTFVFGIFVLLLIAFNNKYSNYKIEFFNNIYAYLFVLSVISMQFIEFVLWRNLNNIRMNRIFSILGLLLLAIQPFGSLLLIHNIYLRNILLTIYSIPTLIYLIYNIHNSNIHTTISKCGHLHWHWNSTFFNKPFINFVVVLFYLFFMLFSFLYNKLYLLFLFVLLLFLILKYYYYKDDTSGSLWCFYVNIIMVYLLCVILFKEPFNELTRSKKTKRCLMNIGV